MLKFSYCCKIAVLNCVLDVDCGGDRRDGEVVVVVVVVVVAVVVVMEVVVVVMVVVVVVGYRW